MRQRVLVISNPAAGQRRTRTRTAALKALRAAGATVELRLTERPGHATELARTAVMEGFDLIVAAGGDGTLNEVAMGLVGTQQVMGILPLGTANVVAAELNLPHSPRRLATLLLEGPTIEVCPLLVQVGGQARVALQMVGAGFDAHAVHSVNLGLKKKVGKLAYVWAMAKLMAHLPHTPLQAVLDGRPHTATAAIIANGRYYAGRFLLAPKASLTSPSVEVVLFQKPGRLAVLGALVGLGLGQLHRWPGVTIKTAREVVLESATRTPVQIDGDAAGTLPLSVRPSASRLRVVSGPAR
jgi:diacylglycerol kinase (ATP)